MKRVSITEAKKMLAELIEEVSKGSDVVITRRGKPVVHLSPVASSATSSTAPRRAGALKGKIHVGPEFFEPILPDEFEL